MTHTHSLPETTVKSIPAHRLFLKRERGGATTCPTNGRPGERVKPRRPCRPSKTSDARYLALLYQEAGPGASEILRCLGCRLPAPESIRLTPHASIAELRAVIPRRSSGETVLLQAGGRSGREMAAGK